MQQGEIKGTFATFVPPAPKNEPQLKKLGVAAAKGQFTGRLTRVQGKPQRPVDIPVPKAKAWNTYQAYACTRTAVQQAETLYQAIRAIAIALDNGIPYADAIC